MNRISFFIRTAFFCSLLLLIESCKKEYSYEGGNTSLIALGSLKDSLGNCRLIEVKGSYQPGIALTGDNYINVRVTITETGTYHIFTDTVNGFYFSASGSTGTKGLQTIQLKAYGKPLVAIAENFNVHFNENVCAFIIPQDSALFTFAEACGSANVNGIYKIATPLNESDTVNILMNVTRPGPYTIQTPTVMGMLFYATGNFSDTGRYMVTLKGSGSPTATGNITIPVTVAGTACSFNIAVSTDTTSGDLYWRFTADGIERKGILDSAIVSIGHNDLYPDNKIYELRDYGKPDTPKGAPISFQINLARNNQSLTAGAYTTGFLGSHDYVGDVEHHDITGNLSSSTTQPSFTIIVTTFDTIARRVRGSFSGTVIDDYGRTHTMKDGAFQTYFKK